MLGRHAHYCNVVAGTTWLTQAFINMNRNDASCVRCKRAPAQHLSRDSRERGFDNACEQVLIQMTASTSESMSRIAAVIFKKAGLGTAQHACAHTLAANRRSASHVYRLSSNAQMTTMTKQLQCLSLQIHALRALPQDVLLVVSVPVATRRLPGYTLYRLSRRRKARAISRNMQSSACKAAQLKLGCCSRTALLNHHVDHVRAQAHVQQRTVVQRCTAKCVRKCPSRYST